MSVDLTDPTRAVTPTLDGPVLAVLAAAGRPLTVGEVAAQAVRGSEIGVRRSLGRLVEQGIVRATEVGRIRVHELNRDHVAAPVAVLLSGLRGELWKRLRETLGGWQPPPLHACVFGSAARGDGDIDSDVDILLVHPLFPDEGWKAGSTGVVGALAGAIAGATLPLATEADVAIWDRQVDDLRSCVRSWTGNSLQVVDLSVVEWAVQRARASRLMADIDRDAVVLVQPTALPRAPKPAKER